MPQEITPVNMRDPSDFTSRITDPNVISVETVSNSLSGLEDRAGANARRRGDLDTWKEGVEAAAKSKDVRSNRTEQLKKDKEETARQLEVKEFEFERLEDQEADFRQQEVLIRQKKAGLESQIKAVNLQIAAVKSELNSLNGLREQAIAKARSDSKNYVEERKAFYGKDRDLELKSLEDQGGMGASLKYLDEKIEKIQGLLGEDVKEAMAEIGRKGEKAMKFVESGIRDLTSERAKLSSKLEALETRRSEVKKLYDARVADVEDAENKRLGKNEEAINRKYDKRKQKLEDSVASLEAKKGKIESKQQDINEELKSLTQKRDEIAWKRGQLKSDTTELSARLDALTKRLDAKKTQADRLLIALDSRMEKAISEQGDITKELDVQVSLLMSAEIGLEEIKTSLYGEVDKEFEEKYKTLKHRKEEGTETARGERDRQIREAMESVGELQVSVDADNRIVVKPEYHVDTSEMDKAMRDAVVLASASESFTKLAAVAPQMREALGAYQTAVTKIKGAFNEGTQRINEQKNQLYEAINTEVNEVKAKVTELRKRAEQAQQLVAEMEEAGEDKDPSMWKRMTLALGRWVSKLPFGRR